MNAERIIPAADLSEQISTAGTEASGTGNMKLALNGALAIGTMDGANIEMLGEVDEENIFIFGLIADEVGALRQRGYNPLDIIHANSEIKQALDMITDEFFSPDASKLFHPVVDTLTMRGDFFLVLADLASYLACQEDVDALYRNSEEWTRKAILNVAGMGKFSSDRTIAEYAEKVWKVTAVRRQGRQPVESTAARVPRAPRKRRSSPRP